MDEAIKEFRNVVIMFVDNTLRFILTILSIACIVTIMPVRGIRMAGRKIRSGVEPNTYSFVWTAAFAYVLCNPILSKAIYGIPNGITSKYIATYLLVSSTGFLCITIYSTLASRISTRTRRAYLKRALTYISGTTFALATIAIIGLHYFSGLLKSKTDDPLKWLLITASIVLSMLLLWSAIATSVVAFPTVRRAKRFSNITMKTALVFASSLVVILSGPILVFSYLYSPFTGRHPLVYDFPFAWICYLRPDHTVELHAIITNKDDNPRIMYEEPFILTIAAVDKISGRKRIVGVASFHHFEVPIFAKESKSVTMTTIKPFNASPSETLYCNLSERGNSGGAPLHPVHKIY